MGLEEMPDRRPGVGVSLFRRQAGLPSPRYRGDGGCGSNRVTWRRPAPPEQPGQGPQGARTPADEAEGPVVMTTAPGIGAVAVGRVSFRADATRARPTEVFGRRRGRWFSSSRCDCVQVARRAVGLVLGCLT